MPHRRVNLSKRESGLATSSVPFLSPFVDLVDHQLKIAVVCAVSGDVNSIKNDVTSV